MRNVQEIYNRLDAMHLSPQARAVIDNTDQGGILIFDGLDEVDVEMLCADIAKEDADYER